MKTLSTSVMAHPSREDLFPYLRSRLGEDVPFALENGGGIWETCKSAWRLRDHSAAFHCVIQDDAMICDNFVEIAENVLKTSGHRAFSFYFANAPALTRVAEDGMEQGFLIRDRLHWGVAVCLAADLIDDMIAFGDTLNIPQDDTRIERFLLSRKIDVYSPMPSLVDHRYDSKSLVGNPGTRQAMYWIDRELV